MLNRHSPLPMYRQIAQILREEIGNNVYSDNNCIGSNKDLAERFRVSLITIRKALQLLSEEGLIVSTQGKGTFIVDTAFRDELHELTGVSNIMASYDVVPEVKVRRMEFASPPKHIPAEFRDGLGAECLYIEREHIVDGAPISFAKLYLPRHYGARLTCHDIETQTIYELYRNKLGVLLGSGIQIIKADGADEQVARALDIPKGTPVLRIERAAFSAVKELIEYMELFYEHSNYSFRVELALR